MPLQKGSSPRVISNNIRELHSGNTYARTSAKFGKERANKQAEAIAFSEARGRAFGGVAPQMANPGGMMSQAFNPVMSPMPQTPASGVASGVMPPPMMTPPMGLNAGQPGPAGARPLATGGAAIKMTTGPLISDVPGRTDKHLTHVPSGAYVIPADIVSGRGEGNTLAGMSALHKLFKIGPESISKGYAKGGHVRHVGKPVPVKLAGGEIVVPPENVHETMERICKKKLTLDQCHRALDKWVIKERKKLRKTLASLPGPARD